MKKTENKSNKKSLSKTNATSYLLISVLAALIILPALGYYLIGKTISPVNSKFAEQNIENNKSLISNNFKVMFQLQSNQLDSLIRNDKLENAIKFKDSLALETISQQWRIAIPKSVAVRLVPIELVSHDDGVNPPIGFSGMDMISTAKTGKRIPAAAIQHNSQFFIRFVSAIADSNQRVIGVAVVDMKSSWLTDGLMLLPAEIGAVKVEQLVEGIKLVVLEQGLKEGNPYQLVNQGNQNWILSYSPSRKITSQTLLKAPDIWAPIILAAIALLVAIILPVIMLQTALSKDSKELTQFVQKLLTGQPHNTPVLKFAALDSLAKSLLRIKITIGGNKEKVKPTSTLPVSSEPATAIVDDSIMDLDLGDTEQDLFDTEVQEEQPIDPSIFKAYDIRGEVGLSLTTQTAAKIGMSIGSEAYKVGEKTVVVARDGRLSSPELSASLIEGLLASGVDVIDIGIVPTGALYFATNVLGVTSGVMVTGSHNPVNHNGFKIVIKGVPLALKEIQAIYQRIESQQYHTGQGHLTQKSIGTNYLKRIIEDIKISRPLKVVVDSGNGVTGTFAPVLFKKLGLDVLMINEEVDGNFPNHHPDPSVPENLTQLIDTVKKTKADLGIAFDGDGDRIGVVTNEGNIVFADRLLMLFAKDLLKRTPGSLVLHDVKCTRKLRGLIVGYGGKAIMWKAGHSLMKRKLKESGALLAGEMSGHFYFKERWYGFDDGLYAAARLLELLSVSDKSSAAVFSAFPDDVCTPEITIEVDGKKKFSIIEQFKQNAQFTSATVTTIDGVRADFTDGWGLVRASNTTDKITLRFEADNEAALNRIKEIFKQQLLVVEKQLNFPF